jgi:hypothetical protein
MFELLWIGFMLGGVVLVFGLLGFAVFLLHDWGRSWFTEDDEIN